jgi:hypothetical protein
MFTRRYFGGISVVPDHEISYIKYMNVVRFVRRIISLHPVAEFLRAFETYRGRTLP